jgi:hypothetical protein
MASMCTLRVARAYLLDGTLPVEREVLCPVDGPLWPAEDDAGDVTAYL